MDLKKVKNYPLEREPINSVDFRIDSEIIQDNFDKLSAELPGLTLANVFTLVNTFQSLLKASGGLEVAGSVVINTLQQALFSQLTVDQTLINDNYITTNTLNGDFKVTGNGTGLVLLSDTIAITPLGGIARQFINKTGSASVKGSVVTAGSIDNSVILQSNEYDSIGVIYNSGVNDGSNVWVVYTGVAEVLLKDTTASTAGHLVFAADTDGRAITAAVPSPPTDTSHFKEIGHCVESKTSGTNILFKTMLHFN